MGQVSIAIGLDAKPLKAGLDGARRDVERFGQSANRSFGQIGKQKGVAGGTGIGGVGMQLQDVAVQLQMGTRLSTVLAQQGSQIASSFGTAGIAIGALIHGYVPADFMASIMGKEAWWAVPAAILIGVPMYTNAAGVIPIVQALLAKGAALGTVLAFMMSVIALSLPETIILRKVLKPRLIITFVSIVATGILIVGYVFNWVL